MHFKALENKLKVLEAHLEPCAYGLQLVYRVMQQTLVRETGTLDFTASHFTSMTKGLEQLYTSYSRKYLGARFATIQRQYDLPNADKETNRADWQELQGYLELICGPDNYYTRLAALRSKQLA
jgi:hypothetical protein